MKIDVIVGCQYGSESKGLAANFVAENNHYDWLVSVNSSQAGHTAPFVTNEGTIQVVTRQLPASCITNMHADIFIGAGAIINPEVLKDEILKLEGLGIPVNHRLYIHRNAVIIRQEDIDFEKECSLKDRIGSTCEGVGAAISHRAMRTAKIVGDLSADELSDIGKIKIVTGPDQLVGDILLEGSQGFGLSPFYHYPFCTSRDTTTAAFLSYAQLNPFDVNDVYGVYRTYPIRVGGNSGPMYGELSWEDVAKRSGYVKLGEYTTVTKRLRRIGEWDKNLAKDATKINGVTKPLLMFVNYLNYKLEGFTNVSDLGSDIMIEIDKMAHDIGMDWYALSTSMYGDWIKFY